MLIKDSLAATVGFSVQGWESHRRRFRIKEGTVMRERFKNVFILRIWDSILLDDDHHHDFIGSPSSSPLYNEYFNFTQKLLNEFLYNFKHRYNINAALQGKFFFGQRLRYHSLAILQRLLESVNHSIPASSNLIENQRKICINLVYSNIVTAQNELFPEFLL